MSNGIYQRFMQLIQSHNLYGSETLLSHIIQIKLVHVLIENQQHQYPYYIRQNEDQLDYNYDIPNYVLSQSLITYLLKQYKFIIKYLHVNEEMENNEITWFDDDKISQLKLELLYGYTFILSKQNAETENHHSFIDLQTAIKKQIIIIEEQIQNSNIFVVIENKILFTRTLQLTYDYEQAFDHIKIVDLLQQIPIQEDDRTQQQKASLQQIFFSILETHVNQQSLFLQQSIDLQIDDAIRRNVIYKTQTCKSNIYIIYSVQSFGESNIDEISALITNVLMLFEITTAEYTSASSKAIKLLKVLSKRIKQTNIQLQTHWIYSQFDDARVQKQRIYHPIQVEQIITFEETDDMQQLSEIKFSYEETLTKTALRPYFEIAKLTTEAYFAYIESLIQQPRILIQSVDPIFYAQKYAQQQYGLSHIFNGHLQRLIATMYSEFLINKRVKDLEVALQQDSDKKIKFLKQEIIAKTRVYLESRVKNKCTQQMEKKFQETKQFLKGKIKTLKSIREGISYDVVCRWSLQAANESLVIYQKYCIEFKIKSLFRYFIFNLCIHCLCLKEIVTTQQYLEKVKNTLEYCYTSISNPDYCRYFYQLGYLRLHVFQIIKMYIEALIGLGRLNPSEKFEVLLAIITENEKFLYHFDQYCSHRIFLFSEANILKQLSQERVIRDRLTQSYRKDEQDLIRYLQIEGDNLAFQKTIDSNSEPYVHVIENVYKDAAHLIEKQTHKFNPDYTGLELFIRAFQICKLLLTSDNALYQKILALVNKLSNRKNSLV